MRRREHDNGLWHSAKAGIARWRVLLATILVLMVATTIPVIYGYISNPEGKRFLGIIYNVHDVSQYLSWMREYGTAIFIENKLTPEASSPIYMNLHWWIPGRLASIFGLSPPAAFQVFRLSTIPLATVMLYVLAGQIIREKSRRHLAFGLSVFASGLGWIWVLEKYLITPHSLDFPRDVYTLAGNTLWSMAAAPQLTFALALMCALFWMTLKGLESERWRWSIGSGIMALFLGMGHIYDLVTVWAVLFAFGCLLVLRDGWKWSRFWRLGFVVLLSAPSAAYWGWVASDANPVWKQALAQYDLLGVFTPSLPHLLILLGIPFLIALATYKGVVPLKGQTDGLLFAKAWFGATLLLIYLPFRFRIMLLNGYQFPLAVLAALGFHDHLLPWLEARLRGLRSSMRPGPSGMRRAGNVLLLLAVLPTNLYLIAWRAYDLSEHEYPFYLNTDDLRAIQWLEDNAEPDDVILSSLTIGHYIPGLTGARPFLSNMVMTMDSARRGAMVEEFFDAANDEASRRELLSDYGVDFIFWGEAERRLGDYDPRKSTFLDSAFVSEGAIIFSVVSQ